MLTKAARASPETPRASTSSLTVSRLGVRFTPRSRLLIARALRRALCASSSWVMPARTRWRLSRSPNAHDSSDRSIGHIVPSVSRSTRPDVAAQGPPEGVSIVWLRCGFFVVLARLSTDIRGTEQAAESCP